MIRPLVQARCRSARKDVKFSLFKRNQANLRVLCSQFCPRILSPGFAVIFRWGPRHRWEGSLGRSLWMMVKMTTRQSAAARKFYSWRWGQKYDYHLICFFDVRHFAFFFFANFFFLPKHIFVFYSSATTRDSVEFLCSFYKTTYFCDRNKLKLSISIKSTP
jgi:hypothetical protein